MNSPPPTPPWTSGTSFFWGNNCPSTVISQILPPVAEEAIETILFSHFLLPPYDCTELAKGVGDQRFPAEGPRSLFSRRKPALSLQCGLHWPSQLLGWVCIWWPLATCEWLFSAWGVWLSLPLGCRVLSCCLTMVFWLCCLCVSLWVWDLLEGSCLNHCCFPRSSIYAFRPPRAWCSCTMSALWPWARFQPWTRCFMPGQSWWASPQPSGLVQLRQLYRGWLFQQSNRGARCSAPFASLHLDLSLQGPFSPSAWARAQGPSTAHLPSAPWRLPSGFSRLSSPKRSVLSLERPLSAVPFCSSWAALVYLKDKSLVWTSLSSDGTTYRGYLSTLLVQNLPWGRQRTKGGRWRKVCLGQSPVRRVVHSGYVRFCSGSVLGDSTFQWAASRLQMAACEAWPWIWPVIHWLRSLWRENFSW